MILACDGIRKILLFASGLCLSSCLNMPSQKPMDSVVVYPHHGKNGVAYAVEELEEKPSPDYEVLVKGIAGRVQPLFVYWAQQHTPGKPEDKENESFVNFDCRGEVEITIKVNRPVPVPNIGNVVIRPLKAEVRPSVDSVAGEIRFKIDPDRHPKQRMLSIEIGGIKRPLFVFANPPDDSAPDVNAPNVHVFEPAKGEDDIITQARLEAATESQNTLFFKPGIHNIEHFHLDKNDLTFNVAGGAVLRFRKQGVTGGRGNVMEFSGKNVRFLGRGIIDTKRDTEALPSYRVAGHVLEFKDSEGVTIDGVTIRHALGFCVVAAASTDVHVSHVKLLGSQDLVSNDGILMDGTKDALIENCFANNHDDSLEVKAHYYVKTSTERVIFRNNVIWSRGGMPMGVCWENWWDIRDVSWVDNTVIHHECYGNGDLCVYVGNRGTVSNIRFEDIDIEDTLFAGICIMAEEHPWSFWKDPRVKEHIPDVDLSGNPDSNWPFFKDIVFRNVTIRHSDAYNSGYFPDPDLHGLGGWGYKLHVPMPEFESGHIKPSLPHDLGGIVFDRVKILDYRDGSDFTRYGRGPDHRAGELIKEHYLTDLTTDNWIVWEGANRTAAHSPEPGPLEKMERIKFWESRIKFSVRNE